VFVREKGYSNLDTLRYSDILEVEQMYRELYSCRPPKSHCQNSLSSTELNSGAILSHETWHHVLTSIRARLIDLKAWSRYIVRCGKRLMARSQRITTSIISTAIHRTTPSKISPVFQRNYTLAIMPPLRLSGDDRRIANTWRGYDPLPKHGTLQKPVMNGMLNTDAKCLETDPYALLSASNAGRRLSQKAAKINPSSAQTIASRHGDGQAASITTREIANTAELNSHVTSILSSDSALVSVVGITAGKSRQAVYNLTVNAVPEYFANGVLVHNCDATRYLIMGIDGNKYQEMFAGGEASKYA
jgi:hypothetical protein